MTAIHIPEEGGAIAPAQNHKEEGTHYSRCPADGCGVVERMAKIGGQSSKGENYLDAAFYTADRRKGLCGSSWAIDTKQGVEQAQSRGINPKWKSGSAATNRKFILSPTSEAYQENYKRIFGHD